MAALRLRGDQARQLVDKADGVEVLQTLPHTRDGAAVADGDRQIVGHFPVQLLGNFEGNSLLALGQIRVDGCVAVVPAPFFNGFGGHLECFLIVALDGNDVRTENHQLRDLALRRALGNEDVGLEACGRREGRGRVARGRAGDDLRARLMRLGDGHGGGAVLQRSGRVDAVVLDPQTAKTQHFCQLRLFIQRAPAHAQRRVGRGFLDRQQLTIAPHSRVYTVFQRFLGEMRLDIIIIIYDIQNPAAGAVGQIRDSLIFLAAAHAARTFDVFHSESSFRFSSATRTASTTNAENVQSVPLMASSISSITSLGEADALVCRGWNIRDSEFLHRNAPRIMFRNANCIAIMRRTL